MKKNLVVGAGFSGAVIARLLAEKFNQEVLIIDKKIVLDEVKKHIEEFENERQETKNRLAKQLKEQGFNHVSLPAFYLSSDFYQMVDYFSSEKEVKKFVNEMLERLGIGYFDVFFIRT